MDDAAQDEVADASRVDLRPRHRLADHRRAERRRRHVLESATVVTDRCADTGEHYHFTSHVDLLRLNAQLGTGTAHRSWASLRLIWTSVNSPGFRAAARSMRTTPSISGASALDRASAFPPSTASTSTRIRFPTFSLRRRVLTLACAAMKRARRSSFTSSGSCPGSSFAFA